MVKLAVLSIVVPLVIVGKVGNTFPKFLVNAGIVPAPATDQDTFEEKSIPDTSEVPS